MSECTETKSECGSLCNFNSKIRVEFQGKRRKNRSWLVLAMNEEIEPDIGKSDQHPSKRVHDNNRWIIGLALMLIGGILLARNLAWGQMDRWWFILLIIPSIGAFTTAWRRYRTFGRTQRIIVIRPVILGFIFLLAAVIPLFDLRGEMVLPLLLITTGMVTFLMVWLR